MPSRVSAAPTTRLTAKVELRRSAPHLLALDERGAEAGLAEGVQDGQPGSGHPDQAEVARRQERGEGEVDDHGGHLATDLLHDGPDHRRSATSRNRHSSWASVRSASNSRATRWRPAFAEAAPSWSRVGQQLEHRLDQRARVSGRHQEPGLALGDVLRDAADPGGDHRLSRGHGLRRGQAAAGPGPQSRSNDRGSRRRRTGAARPRGRPPPARLGPAIEPPRSLRRSRSSPEAPATTIRADG